MKKSVYLLLFALCISFSFRSAKAMITFPYLNLTVNKHAAGGDGDFGFNVAGYNPAKYFNQDFTISTHSGSGSHAVSSVTGSGDSYYITENALAGWQLSDIHCASATTSVGFEYLGSGVRITAQPYSDVICDFTNVKAREPIIIIPGIMGSWNWDVFMHDGNSGTWGFMPFTNIYQPLIDALKDAGYEEGKTLFVAYYDWRLPNVLSAQQYLKPVIEQAKQASGSSKVDIIAHSMGGILARAYIQGGHYENDVDGFFMLGTPNYGSSDVYTTWEGGYIPKNWNTVQRLSLKAYLFYRGVENLALVNGDRTRYEAIHSQISSLRDLLPTYDYIKDKSTDTLKLTSNLAEQNTALNLLNAGIDEISSLVGSITTIAGNSVQTVGEIPVVNRSLNEHVLWVDGKPQPIDPERNMSIGDGVVPLSSVLIPNMPDQITLDNVGHTDLPSMSARQIFERLGITWSHLENHLALVDQPQNILSFSFASPVAPTITDQSGRQISATTNTIPGAVYFGEDDPNGKKSIFIPNPADGNYKIDLVGTADGQYDLMSGYFAQDKPDASQVFSGNVSQGQEISYNAELSAQSSNPLETKPADAVPPGIAIASPLAQDYQRSEQLPISVSVSDPSGVSWSRNTLDGSTTTASTIDLFYQKLGQHNFMVSASDTVGNLASSTVNFRVIATADSTISDIERAYSLGWISSFGAKNSLIKIFQAAVKFHKVITYLDAQHKIKREVMVKRVDKMLLKLVLTRLNIMQKLQQINNQTYVLLKEDIDWLLNN